MGLRDVHDGDFAANKSGLAGITHNPYDLSPRVIGIGGADTFPNVKSPADRVLICEVLPSKRRTDDDHRGTSHVVMFSEDPAAQQGDVEHFEEVRRHCAPLFGSVMFLSGRNGLPGNVKGECPDAARCGNNERSGSALHTCNRLDVLESLASKVRRGLSSLITIVSYRRKHRIEVMCVESSFGRIEASKGADEECSGDEKHQRQTHLEGNQGLAREVLMPAGRRPCARLIQGRSDVWLRNLKRRDEAEQ